MLHDTHTPTPGKLALVLVLTAGACTEPGQPVDPGAALVADAPAGAITEEEADLAALREATAHLHRFENAAPGGWSVQVTGCMENPPEGGMGYHFGDFDRYLDGQIDVIEPEILLYEPQPGGRLRLVAVEYAVPYSLWTSPDPPRLFGRDLKAVNSQGEWQLHVWVWKHNPSGIFEDWNPTVNCDYAS